MSRPTAPVTDDDAALLSAWAAGDRRAGTTLFERNFEAVARFFRNKVDDHLDDLLQKTFLACLESRTRFRQESTFRAFLFGVARNVLSNHYRGRSRDPMNFDGREASVHQLGASPSAAYAADEDQLLVLSALRRIPLDHQVVLELHYWESLTAAEVGTVLDIPVGTAKSRVRRAKQLLAAELNELQGGQVPLESTQTRLDTWARMVRQSLFR